MSRDHRKIVAFQEADRLVKAVYKASGQFPVVERFGLQSQLRRAALSVATNIVEGSTRPSIDEFYRFLYVSHGSARECAYLLHMAAELSMLSPALSDELCARYDRLCGQLLALIRAMQRLK